MKKNILITGALGHIGSWFIHNLKPGDFNSVCLIDNISTQRYSSLFNLPKGVRFNFIEEDICTADLNSYFKGIDVVLHLAAITDATNSFEKKEEVEYVNLKGTEKVAKACIKNGCKLIFPSTTSVYGVQEGTVDEDCQDLKPQSPYAESKLKAEQLLQNLGKEGLNFIICRLGTIFGTSIGMRFHTAVNKFCWQATMKKPITVWRTALNQKRPYLDLRDAINAFRFIIDKDLFDGRIYNVVTTNTTVGEITNIISSYVPDIKIEFVDTKIMNQLSYCVSDKRFVEKGFKFNGSIKERIKETIDMLNGAKV
jgi:nucleoside-diphosphate-sugar epimerase